MSLIFDFVTLVTKKISEIFLFLGPYKKPPQMKLSKLNFQTVTFSIIRKA